MIDTNATNTHGLTTDSSIGTHEQATPVAVDPTQSYAVDSLRYFFDADEPIELRFLGVERPNCTHAGWMTTADIDRARKQVDFMAKISNGTYFTPQILSPDVLKRSPRCHFGNVRRDKKTGVTRPQPTCDADVMSRRFLIIDVDPSRPEGHNRDSASDDEKQHALAVTKKVREYLQEQGWAAPLVVDSGNGYHCYYRLPMPECGGRIANPDVDPLAKLLRLLGMMADTQHANVDETVYNPARIMKLPGTWSKKGVNTPTRPHRQSKIIEVPGDWAPLTDATLPSDLLSRTIADLQSRGYVDKANAIASATPATTVGSTTVAHSTTLLPGELPDMDTRRRRASAYLAKMPPGIEKSKGHKATYAAVCAVVHGFALGADEGLNLILAEFNPRCQPAWSASELVHKVNDAVTEAHREPLGYLLARGDTWPQFDPAIAEAAAMLMRPNPSANVVDAVPDGNANVKTKLVRPDPKDSANTHDDDPHVLAMALLDGYAHPERPTLAYWQGDFYKWTGSYWKRCTDDEIKPEVTESAFNFYKAVQRRNEKLLESGAIEEMPRRCKVTLTLVRNVMNAMSGRVYIAGLGNSPAWIGGENHPPVDDLVPMATGIVNLPRYVAGEADAVIPPTPLLFNTNALTFTVDSAAPTPTRWENFLNGIWPNDPQSIQLLQEWFGYLLTPDNSQQKMLMMVGASRGGKGTITRVLRNLVGTANVCSPSLQSLAEHFGKADLLGKSVAIMDDMHVSNKTDKAALKTVLKSVTGEDSISVARKNKDAIDTKLRVRFVGTANELPRIEDTSSAFANRWCILEFRVSFAGREDISLDNDLRKELAGIFNWSVKGWERLKRQRKFTVPESTLAIRESMENTGSPHLSFIRDCCDIGPGLATEQKQDIFDAWKKWCEETGRREVGTRDIFFKDFLTAARTLGTILEFQTRRTTTDESGKTVKVRPRGYNGVSLKSVTDNKMAIEIPDDGTGGTAFSFLPITYVKNQATEDIHSGAVGEIFPAPTVPAVAFMGEVVDL